MMRRIGRKLFEEAGTKILHCKESLTLRMAGRENSFTRDRILTAAHVVSMIIEPAKQSLQARLKEFGVKFMSGVYATKQAFSKQRQFVNPEFIREFYDEGVETLIKVGELETFMGMHVTAIDGMRIACENTPELIAEFGCSGSKKNACTALASVAYDVMERISYDCQIGSYSLSERALLDRHLDKLASFKNEDFLIVGDRGYPSYDLMATLIDRGFSFVLRLGENWSGIISLLRETSDTGFQYERNGKTYTIRAIKIELAEGKYEYLVTNLSRDILSI